METNALPRYDASENPTNCCPRFKPEGWDAQDLHFDDKLFVRATTRSLFHIPLNMGTVYPRTADAIEAVDAFDMSQLIVLSHDISAWRAEHFFSVIKEVPGQEMVRLTGDFVTKVFEGPYKNAPKWEKELETFVKSQGKQVNKTYFFYTTCPKCAKYYGENYVVGVAGV